ncbi:hypothetical protein B0H11DRAFT_1899106 [Mycena galericulata]|nr:hypothetical protein B0H11DRAFT_1899106 [Mycena galericulata]
MLLTSLRTRAHTCKTVDERRENFRRDSSGEHHRHLEVQETRRELISNIPTAMKIGHQTVPYFYGHTARKNGIPRITISDSDRAEHLADHRGTTIGSSGISAAIYISDPALADEMKSTIGIVPKSGNDLKVGETRREGAQRECLEANSMMGLQGGQEVVVKTVEILF